MKKTLLFLFAFMACVNTWATDYYFSGSENGWAEPGTNEAYKLVPTAEENVVAVEFASLSGEFKIFANSGWGGPEYGAANSGDKVTPNGDAYKSATPAQNLSVAFAVKDATLKFNTETSEITITGTPDATPYYLAGTCKGWNFNATTKFEYQGDGVYTLRYEEFFGDFKVVKNGAWGGDNEYCGVTNIEVGKEYTLVKGGGNASLVSGVTVKNAVITLTVAEDGTHKIKFEGATEEEHSYGLVGNFQGWDATKAPLFTEQADGSWTIDVADFPGGEGFKVSIDKTWTCFCPQGNADEAIEFDVPVTCARKDGNNFTIGTSGEKYNVHVVLAVAADAQSATLTVVDTATGITLLQTAVEADAIFNLAGQRIAQPQKGINIINGKKVMMK